MWVCACAHKDISYHTISKASQTPEAVLKHLQVRTPPYLVSEQGACSKMQLCPCESPPDSPSLLQPAQVPAAALCTRALLHPRVCRCSSPAWHTFPPLGAWLSLSFPDSAQDHFPQETLSDHSPSTQELDSPSPWSAPPQASICCSTSWSALCCGFSFVLMIVSSHLGQQRCLSSLQPQCLAQMGVQ